MQLLPSVLLHAQYNVTLSMLCVFKVRQEVYLKERM